MDTIFDGEVPRARLALLLRHFSELKDNREPWRIVYPLQEVLLLVTCATIASCDDFDDIVAWGKHHLVFLRHFSEFHHGIPCERWLRALLNRNPVRPLFQQLDCRAVAEPARIHRHRRQNVTPDPRSAQRA